MDQSVITSLFGLRGKVALVTGASRGIGRSIALLYAQAGATVVLSSRKWESCESVAEEIRDIGGSAISVACHMGDLEAIDTMLESIQSKFGRLDVVVNNAGINPHFGSVLEVSMSAFDKAMDVNLRGPFYLTQKSMKLMQDAEGGSIINISSIAAERTSNLQGVYSMTKKALVGATKAFAKEVGSSGVRVNTILPGIVETKLASLLFDDKEIYSQAMSMIPMGRHAVPDEMAGVALYLASPASSYMNGACLIVDGGMTI